MRKHRKRWLMTRLRASGSQRKQFINGRYADDRNAKKSRNMEDLPAHESIRKTQQSYSKTNWKPLWRFLEVQIGNDWDTVYAEIISRIPLKLFDQKQIIFQVVADKTEWREGRLWNKRQNIFVYDNTFYVHPETKKLERTP